METITYKGKEYPTRTFLVNNPEIGEPQEITISVESLSVAMEGKYEENGTEEQAIDETIYFYVLDHQIEHHELRIVGEYLDVPMTLIEEITE